MADNETNAMQRITPYLYYKDVAAALDWLAEAFGFSKRFQLPAPDGTIIHAEMGLEEGIIMMGAACEESNSKSPLDLPAVNQSLYVCVADLDAHYARAKAAGARITEEPVEMFWGDRMYAVRDLEDHRWAFAQHLRDVPPDQMQIPPEMFEAP